LSRRRLSDDERALWSGITRSIAPLRRRPIAESPPDAEHVPSRSAAQPKAKPVPVFKPEPRPAPSLVPLGRRFKQEVARGRRAIDGRLDLHGLTQAEAHSALLGFLRATQARGGRLALVITGKGVAGDNLASERGVLRRQVPRWLRLAEFRSYVIGFEPAGIGHGGEGALYVSLRRPRAATD
jgi:DNA-nicking Smr family endonuclease